MNDPSRTPPDALLLMGRHCPWCPTVLKGLQTLQQAKVIGKLETVVIEDHPDIAAGLGVRSVPWVRIGPYELAGLRSEQELREWAEKAGSLQGTAKYLNELLSTGELAKVQALAGSEPGTMKALLLLFADPDTGLNTQIGISAVMELMEGTAALQSVAGELRALVTHADARVRGDACYYLSLSGHPNSRDWVRPLLNDPDEQVRDIALEALGENAR